jgi:Fic family protein
MNNGEEDHNGAMIDTIFAPRYTVTPEIEGFVSAIERSAWLVQNMLIMPKHQAWFQRQVSVKRAAATTRIEGASLSDEQVEEIRKKGLVGKPTDDELANINALAAYEFVDYLSDEPTVPVDELVVRTMNREFLRAMSEKLTPGRYRNGQNTVGQYTPPDQGDVPELMRRFAAWLQAGDDIHPLIKAGIAHIQLVAIHPFWDGNGRVARGLATLIVQRSPYHFKKLLSLESVIFQKRDDYFAAIERTLGSNFAPDYDATPWLEFFMHVLTVHAYELEMELTDWHRSMESVYASLSQADIFHRQADAIIVAMKMRKLRRADYIEIAGVSAITASRDLADLVTKNWLEPHGQGRGRYYTLRTATTEEAPPGQTRTFQEDQ